MLGSNLRQIGARPILASGTCKRENGVDHAELIKTLVQACDNKQDVLQGRIISIASDGESRRGQALSILTLIRELDPTSPIFPFLSHLIFMNLLVGDDDRTGDKDLKHVLKRIRNALLRKLGILVGDVLITPSVLRAHLISNGMPGYKADYLLDPKDKQDVVLMLGLLRAVWSLPPADHGRSPAFIASRNALRTLGSLFKHLVLPYICVDLSLSEQLTHLSFAAHLVFALYLHNKASNRFIPSQLYLDIMIMIKNLYFCVAKVKVDDPEGEYWIILNGTDRLEVLFGILRSMVGNDANLDILQLGSRLSNMTEVHDIFTKHPEWDRGPRRLQMQPLTPDGGRPHESHLMARRCQSKTRTSCNLLDTWPSGNRTQS